MYYGELKSKHRVRQKFSYPLVLRTSTILNLIVRNPRVLVQKVWLKTQKQSGIYFTAYYWAACGPSHKMGFRSSAAKNGLPGEGRHQGLVPRNDVLTNGFIWVSLARSLARILFVPRLCSPWKTHKALRTWRRLFALFEAIRSWESLYNFFIVRV